MRGCQIKAWSLNFNSSCQNKLLMETTTLEAKTCPSPRSKRKTKRQGTRPLIAITRLRLASVRKPRNKSTSGDKTISSINTSRNTSSTVKNKVIKRKKDLSTVTNTSNTAIIQTSKDIREIDIVVKGAEGGREREEESEEGVPVPSTRMQKLSRQLARQKQLEQSRLIEQTDSRQRRYLKRQKRFDHQDGEEKEEEEQTDFNYVTKKKRVQWQDDIQYYSYTPEPSTPLKTTPTRTTPTVSIAIDNLIAK